MAVKAVNDITGPDGLVPTLLVYGAYLRMSKLDPPTPSVTDQVATIRKAMAEIAKLQAKQTVNNALYYRNGLNMTSVYNLPLNSEVLIWRKSGNWTRPYRLLAIEDETCCVELFSGLTNFKSTSVKPYFRSKNTYDAKLDKLEVIVKLDKLEVPTELDKLEAPLSTLEALCKLTEPTKFTVKCG
jgi:hypothetical protein